MHLDQAGYVQPFGSHIQQLVGQTPVYALDCLHLAGVKAQAPLQSSIRRTVQQCIRAILFQSGSLRCAQAVVQCRLTLRSLPRADLVAHEVQRKHTRQGHMAYSS